MKRNKKECFESAGLENARRRTTKSVDNVIY